MDVVVAGAGSIGLLIGSYLAEAGMDVTFYVRRKEQAERIRAEGIQRINKMDAKRIFCAGDNGYSATPYRPLGLLRLNLPEWKNYYHIMQEAHINPPAYSFKMGLVIWNLSSNTALQHVAFATVEHGAGRQDDWTVSHNGNGKADNSRFPRR